MIRDKRHPQERLEEMQTEIAKLQFVIKETLLHCDQHLLTDQELEIEVNKLECWLHDLG